MLNGLRNFVVRTKVIFTTILLCLGLFNSAYALKYGQISQVYFFGDSLTDSGFYDLWHIPAPLPTGKAPTFTTFGGYTWSQYIARDIKGFVLPIYPGPVPADTVTNNAIYAGSSTFPIPLFVSGTLHGIDYAAGGSTTNSTGVGETFAPSLHQEIQFFLANSPPILDPNALYFIWSGANDILKLLAAAPPFPTELQLLTAANAAAINVASEVETLANRGAKRIVVLSLPNIGETPLIREAAILNNLPTLQADIKNVTFTFNSMLNQQLGRVIAKTHVKVLYVDVYTLLDNVILATQAGLPFVIDGQSFRFVNYTDPACNVISAIYCPSTAPNNYVFADTLHPTDMAHRVLSLRVEQLIQAWH